MRKAFVNYINSIVTGSTRGFEHVELAAMSKREKKWLCGLAPVSWTPAIDYTAPRSVFFLIFFLLHLTFYIVVQLSLIQLPNDPAIMS